MTRAVCQLFHRGRFALARQLRPAVPGRFQPYGYTLPNRYPWLFGFARKILSDKPRPRLLSFGCSTGDELISLRRAFPDSTIKGLDISPAAITACCALVAADSRMTVQLAADARGELESSYDAVFCLAVLCHGDLTATLAKRSERLFPFSRFDEAVTDLARCVRPGGFIFLHSTNFRFGDTAISSKFEVVLEASDEQMSPNLLYDRDNRLIEGGCYAPVGFRKRVR